MFLLKDEISNCVENIWCVRLLNIYICLYNCCNPVYMYSPIFFYHDTYIVPCHVLKEKKEKKEKRKKEKRVINCRYMYVNDAISYINIMMGKMKLRRMYICISPVINSISPRLYQSICLQTLLSLVRLSRLMIRSRQPRL